MCAVRRAVLSAAPVNLLDAEPTFAEGLNAEAFEAAHRVAMARVVALPAGPWRVQDFDAHGRGHLGLLMLRGLIAREVGVDSRQFTELLGDGDILRPWDAADALSSVPLTEHWEVLERAELAILDERLSLAMCRWPTVTAALVKRTMERSRSLAVHLAVCHMSRIEDRILVVLWHLADRWGRVQPQGIVLGLRLTHQLIGRIVNARRPTVTTALGGLRERGLVTRREDGMWVLTGDPPGSLLQLRAQTAG